MFLALRETKCYGIIRIFDMAIFHLSASTGSRLGGQSAAAKSDYLEREGRYGTDPEEVEHIEHGNMPAWAEDDPHSYWAAADEHERANGRLFREVEVALPRELDAPELGGSWRRTSPST